MSISAKRRLRSVPTPPPAIVQCPSCQTKFAVDQSVLADIEDPRFHCSRCDHLFGLAEARGAQPAWKRVDSSAALPAEQPVEAFAEESLDNRSADNRSGDSRSHEDREPAQSAPRPTATQQHLPLIGGTRALEIPNYFPPENSREAPHEGETDYLTPISATTVLNATPEKTPSDGSELESHASGDRPHYSFDASPAAQLQEAHYHAGTDQVSPLDNDQPFPVSSFPSEDSGTIDLRSNGAMARVLNASLRALAQLRSTLPSQFRLHVQSVARRAYPKYESWQSESWRSDCWRGFATLALPLFGFLMLLAVGGFYLRADSRGATQAIQALFPTVPQMPPPELFIRNSRFRKISLDTGESVYIISGRVVNQSKEFFREVLVEGILFDSQGTPLMRTLAPVNSALARSKIRSLTPDMIQKSQRQAGFRDGKFHPSTTQDFAIALNDGQAATELAQGRYFSARIYSVKR